MTRRDTVRVVTVLTLVMGLGVLGLGWLLWPDARAGDVRLARGTVMQAVDCGPSNARDGLRIELLDGRAISGLLDGCGHGLGEVLTVEVPDPLPAGDVVVRLPGTGVPAATAQAQRIGAVGVVVAGTAGALLAWRLRSHCS
ncbi:MAG TPA: hypothetical protein VE645_16740 [Pseudonocardiaceae bacterium]|nr:hypothetical protein [Pseudonocardiaceae bacterium]